MDYVVFGIGFGATILVLGLLLRDFGPRLRYRAPRDSEGVLSAERLVGKVSWTRFCSALGSVLALAGAVFLLITLVSMVLVVSDDTGLWVMAVAYGLLILLMVYWTWAYFHRFGSFGILPERVKTPEPAPVTATPRRPAPDKAQPYAGPAVPAGVVDAPVAEEPESIAAEAAVDAEPATSEEADEHAVDEPAATETTTDDQPTEPVEPILSDDAGEDETDETVAETSPRLETPEERLAHHETPIDHGSAEGDLDLASAPGRRPGPRLTRNHAEEADSSSGVAGPPIPSDLKSPH